MELKQERRRDNQQWMLDWVVKNSGRVINLEYDDREVTVPAKNYAMIPKTMGRVGAHRAAVAAAAENAGHQRSALDGYVRACTAYHVAQHSLFQDDNQLKIHYHDRLLECFDGIMRCARYPIERVEVPWESRQIQCNLYMLPDRRKAPCIVFIPGMDMVKEMALDPATNPFIDRGMHCIVMDGPGQGTSNIRKIRVTDNNYERAASAVIDYVGRLPEVDATRIGLMGRSMGSFWGLRTAAHDPRVKAAAVSASCLGDKVAIFEQSSPRFKQVFMYMSGLHDEAEFDRMAAKMTTVGYGAKVRNPFLIVTGEYDPLCPLEDAERTFDELAGPKEIWVLENDFHAVRDPDNLGNIHCNSLMADWLRDALNSKLAPNHKRYVYLGQHHGLGPYSEPSATYATVTP